jgi:hypothetical protein
MSVLVRRSDAHNQRLRLQRGEDLGVPDHRLGTTQMTPVMSATEHRHGSELSVINQAFPYSSVCVTSYGRGPRRPGQHDDGTSVVPIVVSDSFGELSIRRCDDLPVAVPDLVGGAFQTWLQVGLEKALLY